MVINDADKALDQLFTSVQVRGSKTDLAALFEFIRRIPTLGAYNAALVNTQRRGVVYVATEREWRRSFGRELTPGARPLVILRPFGPVDFVYDVSDTEGMPVPDRVLHPFRASGEITEDGYAHFTRRLSRAGISCTEVSDGSARAGAISRAPRTRPQMNGSTATAHRYDLVVNSQLDTAAKLATVIHELGHLFCGHLGAQDEDRHRDRCHLSLESREFEAESVSWLLCGRIGIDSPAADYLSGYFNSDGSLPPVSVEEVVRAVSMIEQLAGGAPNLREMIRTGDPTLFRAPLSA